MNYKLNIGWLYPELMSTYGDRGNIFVLTKRCEWRNIAATIQPVDFKTTPAELTACDLVFGGGAQDRQQGLVISDLRIHKGPILKEMFGHGTPGLFVCGAPQLLGHFYMTGDGQKLEGLGIFDMVSKHFGKDKPRCIGNTIGKLEFGISNSEFSRNTVVGFENHGGRTYLGKGVEPFTKILYGSGNNGEDGTEGSVYKNCIATYSHGPFLPKNPHIADWLIGKALEIKYQKQIKLDNLDDSLEWQAHDFMLDRLGIMKSSPR
jgi:CobQ-like glutamine amidotransferase family enzyme